MTFIRDWLHGPSTVDKCVLTYLMDEFDIDDYMDKITIAGNLNNSLFTRAVINQKFSRFM